ncbi:MAG: hypothetical protein ACFBQW_06090 [Sphingomonadaceae bacterium]
MEATLTAPARSPRLHAPGRFAAELFARHRLLASYAALCLLGALATSIAMLVDPRTILGVSVWLKPTKFFLSIAVFAGTAAWFFGYVRSDRRRSWLLRITVAILLLAASFELFWITFQGARGLASHFNFDTPFYATMYSLMGVGAVLLVSTTLPLAWEIARRPAPGLDPAYRLAVVLGLVMTFGLGGSLGGYISASGGAAVGAHASVIPLFAWNQAGGDLRVAHFFGIHAQQALPLFAAALAAMRAPARLPLVLLAALAWAALTLGTWAQAVAGRPFPFG